MTYPNIATFLSASRDPGPGFDAAIALARRQDAHLRVVAPGIDRISGAYSYGGTSAIMMQENAEAAQAEAAGLHARIEARLAALPLRWEVCDAVVQAPALSRHLAEQLRLCDLFVHSSPYQRPPDEDGIAALEAALFGAGVPTLVVPPGTEPEIAPDRVLIAWNESDEALRAVRGALPFLRAASEVAIVLVDPTRRAGRAEPGGALATYLTRHGIQAEVSVLARAEPDVANILIRRARESGAGLIVMGAYGHSRLREAMVGGATRHMLERAPLPVLMAH
jgi:nucleotide-binding universal stress UspA family protein